MKKGTIRHWFQAAFFALTNGYAQGFIEGKIYKGPTKVFCVPGLNCYSCPGALNACPIGSLQAVLGSQSFNFSCYVFGLLMAFGTLMGRFVCGWLCPFGLVQDLLHKIPLFKKMKNMPGHDYLKKLKYVMLFLFVIILPLTVVNIVGMGKPWFCEYVCPSGTLLGGIPLISMNPELRDAIGGLFIWKLSILILVIVLSIKYYRPFCKYLCPLGALYGFFNPISFYRFRIDEEKCVKCGACSKACQMGIDVCSNPNSMECIRCGACKNACPKQAITSTYEQLGGAIKDKCVREIEEDATISKTRKSIAIRVIALLLSLLGILGLNIFNPDILLMGTFQFLCTYGDYAAYGLTFEFASSLVGCILLFSANAILTISLIYQLLPLKKQPQKSLISQQMTIVIVLYGLSLVGFFVAKDLLTVFMGLTTGLIVFIAACVVKIFAK